MIILPDVARVFSKGIEPSIKHCLLDGILNYSHRAEAMWASHGELHSRIHFDRSKVLQFITRAKVKAIQDDLSWMAGLRPLKSLYQKRIFTKDSLVTKESSKRFQGPVCIRYCCRSHNRKTANNTLQTLFTHVDLGNFKFLGKHKTTIFLWRSVFENLEEAPDGKRKSFQHPFVISDFVIHRRLWKR